MLAGWSPSGAALLSCRECALSQVSTRARITLDVARTVNANTQTILKMTYLLQTIFAPLVGTGRARVTPDPVRRLPRWYHMMTRPLWAAISRRSVGGCRLSGGCARLNLRMRSKDPAPTTPHPPLSHILYPASYRARQAN